MSWLDDPQALNSAGTSLDIAGAIYGALGKIDAGEQARKASIFQARQLQANAGQEMAAAQRSAEDIDKQEQLLTSAAIASAAASGGGAGDPTVVGLIARNSSQMAYRKALALYSGEDRARSLNLAADARMYEGELERNQMRKTAAAQVFGTAGSLLKGYARDSSLRQRFGGTGPDLSAVVE